MTYASSSASVLAERLVEALSALHIDTLRITADDADEDGLVAFVDVYDGPKLVDSIQVHPEHGYGIFSPDTAYTERPECWVSDPTQAAVLFRSRNGY